MSNDSTAPESAPVTATMATYQITEEEMRLLDAAKRVCSLWGHHHGNLLTHRGGREEADAALVQQLQFGAAVVNGQFVRDIVKPF